MDEARFEHDVRRRLRAITDANRLAIQIGGVLDQLAELERRIGEHGYTAPGAKPFLTEAAEANGLLQTHVLAHSAAERVIRETNYILPMLSYGGGEASGHSR